MKKIIFLILLIPALCLAVSPTATPTQVPTQQAAMNYDKGREVTNLATQQFNLVFDTASNDTYSGTCPFRNTHNYVDGMMFLMKVNTANTGEATGNINGWGAKSICIQHDITNLPNDYIEACQWILLIYNRQTDCLELINGDSNP
jgi:hypothetical protein